MSRIRRTVRGAALRRGAASRARRGEAADLSRAGGDGRPRRAAGGGGRGAAPAAAGGDTRGRGGPRAPAAGGRPRPPGRRRAGAVTRGGGRAGGTAADLAPGDRDAGRGWPPGRPGPARPHSGVRCRRAHTRVSLAARRSPGPAPPGPRRAARRRAPGRRPLHPHRARRPRSARTHSRRPPPPPPPPPYRDPQVIEVPSPLGLRPSGQATSLGRKPLATAVLLRRLPSCGK